MPSEKDAYWFPHDSNARNDPKLARLKMEGGHEAIGCWWELVECLREADGYRIPLSDLAGVEYACRFPNGVITLILECGLLIDDGEQIFSPSLNRRMERFDEIKEQRRKAGRKGGKTKAKNAASKAKAKLKQNPSGAKAKVEQSFSKALANPTYKRTGQDNIGEDMREENTLLPPSGGYASFDAFWLGVSCKISKKDAEKVWKRVQAANSWDADQWAEKAKQLSEHQQRLIQKGASPIHPATWLRGERWQDEGVTVEDEADRLLRLVEERKQEAAARESARKEAMNG